MAKKTIFALNVDLPGEEDERIDFRSDRSLLDADIVLASPDFSYRFYSSETYNGRPLLGEGDSFRAPRAIKHWRSELKLALENGRTVFFFLSKDQEFYVYTGSKEFSGTGRNRVTTNHVRPINTYEMLPVNIGGVTSRRGKKIKIVRDLGPFAEYWKTFGPNSEYEAYLEGSVGDPLLATATGNKTVGTVLPVGKGHLVILPPLSLDYEKLSEWDEEVGDEVWTTEGVVLGKRIVSALVAIDRGLQSQSQQTPAPDWTRNDDFRLSSEQVIETQIAEIDDQISALQADRSGLEARLEAEGVLRGLLFEKGKPLEEAIMLALTAFGFEAENYTDSESEFDVVFMSEEGRCIGEAEGKDTRAINIGKLSQLEREIQEDFARDKVEAYAKGVLFGNAYRLDPPDAREDFFTAKCLSGAARSKVALVRTPDLFAPAKYLRENSDPDFAQACRVAIISAEGSIVSFPSPPKKPEGRSKKGRAKNAA